MTVNHTQVQQCTSGCSIQRSLEEIPESQNQGREWSKMGKAIRQLSSTGKSNWLFEHQHYISSVVSCLAQLMFVFAYKTISLVCFLTHAKLHVPSPANSHCCLSRSPPAIQAAQTSGTHRAADSCFGASVPSAQALSSAPQSCVPLLDLLIFLLSPQLAPHEE